MTLEQYNFLIDLAEHGSKFNGYKTHKSYIPIIKRIYKSLNNLVSGDPEKDLEAANIFLDNLWNKNRVENEANKGSNSVRTLGGAFRWVYRQIYNGEFKTDKLILVPPKVTDTAPLSQNEIDLVDKAIDEYVASAPNEYIFKQRKHLANMLTIIKNGGKRLTEVARIKFNEVEPNFSDGFVTFKMRAEKSNREILCGVEQNMFNELKESGFIYKNDVSASRCIYTFVRKLNKFIIEKYNVDLHLHPHKFRHNFVAVLLRTINPNTGNFHTTQDISECTGNLPSTLEKHYKHLVPERCVEVLKSISPNIVRNNGVWKSVNEQWKTLKLQKKN